MYHVNRYFKFEAKCFTHGLYDSELAHVAGCDLVTNGCCHFQSQMSSSVRQLWSEIGLQFALLHDACGAAFLVPGLSEHRSTNTTTENPHYAILSMRMHEAWAQMIFSRTFHVLPAPRKV